MASVEIRDPVHGFIKLQGDEVKLLDTKVLQRLRGIKQLAMAHLVYPGALHTRFDHTLGVTHVAGLMAKSLGLKADEITLVRLAALLHDIGHGPFSHVSEYVLEQYADESNLSNNSKTEKIHEIITGHIIQNNKEITFFLGTNKCRDIAELLSEGYGQPALKSIISGPLDADKQDYLLRDSHFCGVEYGIYDIGQLHRSLELHGDEDEEQLMIKPDGVHALEQYVLAKYYLTTNVYKHKVRLITEQMIIRAIVLGIEKDELEELKQLYTYDGSDDFYDWYVSWDDAKFFREFLFKGHQDSKCRSLLNRLVSRKLLKRVYFARVKDFDDPQIREKLGRLSEGEDGDLKTQLEESISELIQEKSNQIIDPDYTIFYPYSIKSVRETSRDDESGILVFKEKDPVRFDDESTLFRSINEAEYDQFLEVYAPIEWTTRTDKKKLCRDLSIPVKQIIEEKCRDKKGN